MKREFAEENQAATAKLKELTGTLDEAEYRKPVGNGWTVTTLLCHMAMWDGRVFYTLKQWQDSGEVPSNIPKGATDLINLASRDVFDGMLGRTAAEIAVRRAETLDTWLETLSDEFCEKVLAAGFERMLRRSLHRTSHLSQIHQALV